MSGSLHAHPWPGSYFTYDSVIESLRPELRLLNGDDPHTESDAARHERRNAPLFTTDALAKGPEFPQRAVLGSLISQHTQFTSAFRDPRVYINTDTPFSSVICGVQGSGKSHTASVLLEGCLISNEAIGTFSEPLAGLCLHYDTQPAILPCEAAYLSMHAVGEDSSAKVPVTVLVSPTNFETMRAVYKDLPLVNVQKFQFWPSILNSRQMLSLMECYETGTGHAPLYLPHVSNVLREMGSDRFFYLDFKEKMRYEAGLSPEQLDQFNMTMRMLKSYLNGTTDASFQLKFKAGNLVIVDLRDPFINTSLALTLFDIVVQHFRKAPIPSGKVILLDEAHRYFSESNGLSQFAASITSIIREQRRCGISTLISTQDPTCLPHAILDLASILIIHRVSSPSWTRHLAQHFFATSNGEAGETEWMTRVTQLRVGEAMVVAPSGLGVQSINSAVLPFSTGYLIARTRRRITVDGGSSKSDV